MSVLRTLAGVIGEILVVAGEGGADHSGQRGGAGGKEKTRFP